jgi:hypothetical protein
MSPASKRILFAWIATDVVWCALFVRSLKRDQQKPRID